MTLEHTKKHLESSWDRGRKLNGKFCGILQDKPIAQGHAERHAEALGGNPKCKLKATEGSGEHQMGHKGSCGDQCS